MSITHATVSDYWQSVAPRLNEFMSARRDRSVENLIEQALAVYAYVFEDVGEKRTRNQHLAGHLESLMVQGMDLIRGALAAQVHQSLMSAALNARTAFELQVTMRFITNSAKSDLYAGRFARFQMVEKLNRHYHGGVSLSPDEVGDLTAQCAEWIDSKTGRPRRDCKWHAEPMGLRGLAAKVGETEEYEKLYTLNSLFTHGSSIIQNFYRRGNTLQPGADVHHVSSQSILTIGSCLRMMGDFALFFGMRVPETEMVALANNLALARGGPGAGGTTMGAT